MTASRSSRALALGAGMLAAGCASPAVAPLQAMDPLPSARAYVPDDVDLALRDLGRALLAGDAPAVDLAVERVERLDAQRSKSDEDPSGALPYALDARHALIHDPALYRSVSALLLERGDLAPPLRSRLEQEVDDDPLQLAEARLRDARTLRFGRIFNALSEAAGRSFSNTLLLGYRVATAVLALAVAERTDDVLSLPERQALAHWKQFVEQHPEAPEAPAVVARIDEAQQRWYRTQRDRTVHAAERALDRGDARLGLALSERAVRYASEDDGARSLLARAERETSAERARLSRSERASLRREGEGPAQQELALALLAAPAGRPAAIESAAAPLAEAGGPGSGEARFALALAAGESGERGRMWDELEDLSRAPSPMARHAAAAVSSPEQNPYRFWRGARRAARSDRVRFVLFGSLAEGPRDRPRISRPVEYLLELPALVPMVTGLPQRLVRAPFVRDERRSPAVFAARYLEREPDGEHAAEVRSWLVAHEEARGNAAGALAIVEADPDAEGGDLARLRVEASEQVLKFALAEEDLPTRVALLRKIGREYEGTPASREAVAELRRTVREATPQHIRISRGFLTENPSVAGPDGLALRPELLDGVARNGELHPDGVALLGGSEIEIAYLGEGGDPRDPPVLRRQRVSEERVQRMIAVLEEASLRKALTDPAYPVEYDADRDLFFERARLGLAEEEHPSLEARSRYAFRGIRERYGLVRRRDSILPVELVVQGSIEDLTLGAFPRIRLPKRTPDAFLYE